MINNGSLVCHILLRISLFGASQTPRCSYYRFQITVLSTPSYLRCLSQLLLTYTAWFSIPTTSSQSYKVSNTISPLLSQSLATILWLANSQPMVCLGRCRVSNGGCSQLCLATSANDRVCACGLGFTLASDGVTCNSGINCIHIY